jgi:ferrous iron transport protein B
MASWSWEKFNNRNYTVFKTENAGIQEELDNKVAAYKLENSYIGIMEKVLNLLFLGYDWKIGIAIISSLLREKSVGTLATIYSVGSTGNEDTIKMAQKSIQLRKEGVQLRIRDPLLLFYAFALQCASTIAITRKETNSWKWPLGNLS